MHYITLHYFTIHYITLHPQVRYAQAENPMQSQAPPGWRAFWSPAFGGPGGRCFIMACVCVCVLIGLAGFRYFRLAGFGFGIEGFFLWFRSLRPLSRMSNPREKTQRKSRNWTQVQNPESKTSRSRQVLLLYAFVITSYISIFVEPPSNRPSSVHLVEHLSC